MAACGLSASLGLATTEVNFPGELASWSLAGILEVCSSWLELELRVCLSSACTEREASRGMVRRRERKTLWSSVRVGGSVFCTLPPSQRLLVCKDVDERGRGREREKCQVWKMKENRACRAKLLHTAHPALAPPICRVPSRLFSTAPFCF